MIFKNFKEAALFAKKQSIELKTLHAVKREDSNWIVLSKGKSYSERIYTNKERKEYYLSLSEGKLDELWLESDTLIETEKSLLRSVLRHKKGYGLEIKREYVPEFCGKCNMTIEVCTCKERSWW
tara:strand:- start:159 stop:530 length:372 start_codon:yes stop_codon:yes gene_type:complete